MTNQPEKPDGSKPIPHQPNQPEQADPPKTEILPPAGDDAAPDWIDPEDLPPELQFDPIPTIKRWTGITPQKQRQFIAHLAATGAVGMAARAIGVSTSALYTRRQKPGAESFAAAWDRAVEMGARRVLDTLMEHAIHGTPETLLQGKEVILERRKYNTRSMMWIVQQRFPEQYGGALNIGGRPASSLPHGMKALKEQWSAEWEAERAEEEQREAEEEAEAEEEFMRRMAKLRAACLRETAEGPAKPFGWEDDEGEG